MSRDVTFDPPRHMVTEAVARAVAEDLGPLGDISAALLPDDAVTIADFVPRAPGVLAGTACATEAYAQLDGRVRVTWSASDGDRVEPDVAVGRVEGPLRAVLTGERTALNFLCHLSGIATLTRCFVDAAVAGGSARIVETRKTLPGLRALEKAAVRAGGGANHRGSLSDMVLVKDNHLAGMSIAEAVARARSAWPGRGVEIECDRAEQVEEAVAAEADVVMLDNMTPEAAAACVALVRGGARPRTLIEISGGVTLATVAAYAATGADVISTGAITQSAPALDLGLDLASE
ncbi:MAG: carboxylating nicotinate-nucleotide diphosphorylase [Acidimicrobiia bacterium]